MRAATFAALIGTSAVYAQQGGLASILQMLQAANLTSLASAAEKIANTTTGQSLLAILTSGQTLTVFAPNNHAFTGVPTNISSNADLLADVLAYHVVPGGAFNSSSFFNNSNTILRTALNSTSEVFLGVQGERQAIALRIQNDNKTHILNQNTPATIVSSNTTGNITLNIVDSVIDLPGDLEAAVKANNLTLFATAATTAGIFSSLNLTHGLTIFAPTDAAFTALMNQPGAAQAASNKTMLATILGNHVVNGTELYSTELGGTSGAVSASGEPFTFNTTASGTTVKSGNSTANITTADVILWNGVVHIIDAVLANNLSNAGAASSAFASATSAAASQASVQATATSPAGQIGTPAPGGVSGNGSSSGGSGGKGGAVDAKGLERALVLVALGVLGGVFVL